MAINVNGNNNKWQTPYVRLRYLLGTYLILLKNLKSALVLVELVEQDCASEDVWSNK
jgi:hypothetical protein